MEGWISLHRKVRLSAVWQDPELFRLWCLCLLKATHKPHKQLVGNQTVDLMPGQFVTGRDALAEEYNRDLSPSKRVKSLTLWRWLQKLEKLENLNIKSTNKFSVVTVVNWSQYQEKEQQMNNKRTTNEQQMITNNNGNKTEEEDLLAPLEREELGKSDLDKIKNTFSQKSERYFFDITEEAQMSDLLYEKKIPIETILEGIEQAFKRYKPKRSGDKIKSFKYCYEVILDLNAEKEQPKQSQNKYSRQTSKRPNEPARGNVMEQDYPDSVQLLKAMEQQRKKEIELMEAT